MTEIKICINGCDYLFIDDGDDYGVKGITGYPEHEILWDFLIWEGNVSKAQRDEWADVMTHVGFKSLDEFGITNNLK